MALLERKLSKYAENMDRVNMIEMLTYLKRVHSIGGAIIYSKSVEYDKGQKQMYESIHNKDFVSITTAVKEVRAGLKRHGAQIVVFRLFSDLHSGDTGGISHYYALVITNRIVGVAHDRAYYLYDSRIMLKKKKDFMPRTVGKFLNKLGKGRCYKAYGTQQTETDCGCRVVRFVNSLLECGQGHPVTEALLQTMGLHWHHAQVNY